MVNNKKNQKNNGEEWFEFSEKSLKNVKLPVGFIIG